MGLPQSDDTNVANNFSKFRYICLNHAEDNCNYMFIWRMAEVGVTVMMMAGIEAIEYFILAHQRIHLILLQLSRPKQKRQEETVAAAAALNKHQRMRVVLTSFPKLKLPTASLIPPPLSANRRAGQEGRRCFVKVLSEHPPC